MNSTILLYKNIKVKVYALHAFFIAYQRHDQIYFERIGYGKIILKIASVAKDAPSQ